MHRVILARRSAPLPASLPASPPADHIPFDSGHAFPGLLPDLTGEAHRALAEYRAETLQYAPRAGLPELRAWIAEHLAADGVSISGEHILVTHGAKQAIDLICRVLLDEGDSIVVTAPTYFTAIPIFRSFGVTFLEVGQDEQGLDVDELAGLLRRRAREGQPVPKFVYDVPDFHNPTGVSMSLERRTALIELAAQHGMFIVEDSPYRKIRFEGQPVPSLKALDQAEVVIQVGTFSKLMAPGLRVGWAAAAPGTIARMLQLKSDGGSCPLTQRIIVEFCGAGRLAAHIARVQEIYRANRDRMVLALGRELPEVSVVVPRGGYYLWLTLPRGRDGDELTKAARAAGVIVLSGSKFFAGPEPGRPKEHIRVAYSHAAGPEIDEGVRRLASAFRTLGTGSVALAPG